MTLLDDAIVLARQGFRVFPLRPNDKRPAVSGWQDIATNDVATVQKMWSNGHADCNIGVRTGGGLVVLDFDTKDGRSGLADLARMETTHGLPHSIRVRTPSGGVHVFLSVPVEYAFGNAVATIPGFPGMDVRADGGYVAAAGSVTPDGIYEAFGNALEAAPASILALLKLRREPSANAGQIVGDLDDAPAIARAVEYLKHDAPLAYQGDHGDDTTYRVACRVMDFGISPNVAYATMLEHWNGRCEPPWDAADLKEKVRNARRYRQEPLGVANTSNDFEPASSATSEPVQRDRPQEGGLYPLETMTALRALPPAKWLVDKWVPEGGTGILVGKWGSGKTFLAFDLASHLAYGMPDWHGAALPGEPVNVLLLAREGHVGFVDRIDAFKRRHGIDHDTDALQFMRASVDFMQDKDFQKLGRTIHQADRRFALTIVDTVARVMPGAEMSKPEAVTRFMERCARIAERTGGAVMGVHHFNKGGTTMGSVYFEANSDFVFEIERPEELADGPLVAAELRCTKMKDGEDGWLRDVRFGKEVWGDIDAPRSSLVVSHILQKGRAMDAVSLSATLQGALDIVRKEDERGKPISIRQGRGAGPNGAMIVAKSLRIRVMEAQRLLDELIVDGVIEEYQPDGRGWRLRAV
jgi:hypothetical protein